MFEYYSNVTCMQFSRYTFGLYPRPVGLSGLEPPTSRLSGVRSNLLSYKPIPQFPAVGSPGKHKGHSPRLFVSIFFMTRWR